MEPRKREVRILLGSSRTQLTSLILALAAILSFGVGYGTQRAQASGKIHVPSVILPLVHCWYKGQVVYYIQTETSDAGLAQQQGVNYAPSLANAISANPAAVGAIYHVTNFMQANVIPSAPIPAGPGNTDPSYSPLWQVILVTWNPTASPYVLKSEEDVLNAQAEGLVTIASTDIVVNCPVIYTPSGGVLPTATIIGKGR